VSPNCRIGLIEQYYNWPSIFVNTLEQGNLKYTCGVNTLTLIGDRIDSLQYLHLCDFGINNSNILYK